jgi:hypothetical protein
MGKALHRKATDSKRPSQGPVRAGKNAIDPDMVGRWRGWLLFGVMALLVARPLLVSETSADEGDRLVFAACWLGALACWAVAIGRTSRGKLQLHGLDAALGLLVAWHTLAAVVALRETATRATLNMLWQWIGLAAAYFLLRQLRFNAREVRALTAVMISLAVGIACLGLVQYFVLFPAQRAEYFADPDGALRSAGLYYPPGSRERFLFEQRLNSTEPTGTFALANSLAGFLATWAVLLVAIAWRGFRGSAPNAATGRSPETTLSGQTAARRMLACLLLVVPLASCLLLTKSRSAYLAGLLGVGLAAWQGRSKTTHAREAQQAAPARRGIWAAVGLLVIGLVVIGIPAAAILSGALDVEVLSEAPRSLAFRWQYWKASAAMVAESPWLGCGPGQFSDHYTRFKLPEASEEIQDPHNLFWELAATAGIPAGVLLLAVLGIYLACVLRPAARRTDADRSSHTKNPDEDSATTGESRDADSALDKSRLGDTNRYPRANLYPDASRYLLVGGLGGLLLTVLLRIIFGPVLSTSPDGVALTIIALGSAVSIAVLLPWIRQGQLPRGALTAAAIALIVNLLAAGGISYGGVALSLWLLIVLDYGSRPWLINGSRHRQDDGFRHGPNKGSHPRTTKASSSTSSEHKPATRGTSASSHGGSPYHGGVMLAIGLVAAVLCIACVNGSLVPAVVSQAHFLSAQGSPRRVESQLLEAAQADPLADRPWHGLAQLRFERLMRNPQDEPLREAWAMACRELLKRRPDSAPLRDLMGIWYQQLYAASDRPDDLDQARDFFRAACRLYPNRALYQARLAIASLEAGDADEARQAGERAKSLDRRTPHADLKLPRKIRLELEQRLPSLR